MTWPLIVPGWEPATRGFEADDYRRAKENLAHAAAYWLRREAALPGAPRYHLMEAWCIYEGCRTVWLWGLIDN